jgi:hypothetical protein
MKDGKLLTFELGELKNERGEFTYVYDLKAVREGGKPIPGCETNCIVKIGKPEQGYTPSVRDAAIGTVEGAQILKDFNIPQVEILYDGSKATRPFVIKRKVIEPKGFLINSEQVKWPDGTFRRVWTRETLAKARSYGMGRQELSRAVTDLAYKMKEAKVGMEDFHDGNLCIEFENNKPVAKVIDQDRIVKYYDRSKYRQGWWIGYYEANISVNRVPSMYQSVPLRFENMADARRYFSKYPGPYFPDVEFFWHKQFEYKGWLNFTPSHEVTASGELTAGGTWEDGLLDLKIVKEKFPHIDDPANLRGIDMKNEYWKQRGLEPPANDQGIGPTNKGCGLIGTWILDCLGNEWANVQRSGGNYALTSY